MVSFVSENEMVMFTTNGSGATRKPEGKYKAMVVCFILGLGSLVSWNSMLTIADYYYKLFPVKISSFKGTNPGLSTICTCNNVNTGIL